MDFVIVQYKHLVHHPQHLSSITGGVQKQNYILKKLNDETFLANKENKSKILEIIHHLFSIIGDLNSFIKENVSLKGKSELKTFLKNSIVYIINKKIHRAICQTLACLKKYRNC